MNKLGFLKLITLKRAFIALGGLLGLAALGAACFVLYFIIPSGFQSRHAEGPAVLTELLKMADHSQPFNSDPYISSTYRPSDPLYEPVLNIQRKRWDLAETQLKPLVAQNNADAMFWLGEITYGGYFDADSAATLYKKSAELGNPYAALRLDEDSYICQTFMGYYCDKKWGKLGRKLLKQRADNGDLKAAFYLVKIDINEFSDSEELHEQLEDLATANAKHHYYQPLMFFVSNYIRNAYATLLNKEKKVSFKNKKLAVKLAVLAANNNFPPAINVYVFHNRKWLPNNYTDNTNYVRQLVNKGMKLDIHGTVYQDYYAVISQPRSDVVKGASYAVAEDIIKNKSNHNSLAVYQYMMKENNLQPLTEPEINQAKEMAPKLINQMTPVIYIDEMNPRP